MILMSRFLLTLLAFFGGWILATSPVNAQVNNFNCPGGAPICAADMKQCPDGSLVSRVGCKCEFAACPNEIYASPLPSVSPEPPPGCYLQQVECVQAPCPPILVCPTPTPSPVPPTCVRAGCSGQLCLSEVQAAQMGTTACLFKPEYACYQQATCEVQASGQCGFTQTTTLAACLAETDTEDHPIQWQTEYATLTADDFYIMVNGKRFTGKDATFTVHSDPAAPQYRYTTLEVNWQENGAEMRFYIYFHHDDTSWWSNEYRVYNGDTTQPNWIFFTNALSDLSQKNGSSFFVTPLGQTYAESEFTRFSNNGGIAHIYFKNLRLQAFPTSVNPATLGDINDDGTTNIMDYSAFVQGYKGSTEYPKADLNGDNTINLLDYSIFIQQYTL